MTALLFPAQIEIQRNAGASLLSDSGCDLSLYTLDSRIQARDPRLRTLITRQERPREDRIQWFPHPRPAGRDVRSQRRLARSPPPRHAKLAGGAVEWALARTRAALRRHDIAAALLIDPVNVRYATGTAVMPVWTLHSIDRYLLVPAEGEPVLWEYASTPPELTSPNPLLETRTATTWAVFGSGEHSPERAALGRG
jgi:hypothetical protein